MEKTLTRLKSNLKSRRKLSLPMLVGQFHHQWNGSSAVKTPESPEVEPETTDESDQEPEQQQESKAWLSFGKSRVVGNRKNRNKPRRWPSTPAFPPGARHHCSQSTSDPASSLPPPIIGRPQPFIQGYHLTLPISSGCATSRNCSHSTGIVGGNPCRQEAEDDGKKLRNKKQVEMNDSWNGQNPFSPSDGSSSSVAQDDHQSSPRQDPNSDQEEDDDQDTRSSDEGRILRISVSKEDQPPPKALSSGLGHQTAASSLAISLPAIHFQSDAEIDGLRRRPRAAALKAATGSASRRGNSVDDVDADEDDEDDASLVNSASKQPEQEQQQQQQRRVTKLKRRKAYYRHKKDGRSKSLTHIDTLDPGMLVTSPSTSSPRISSKEEGDYHSGLGSSDMTTSQHQLSSVGGSQDRLLCVPMVGSNSSSTATTPVGGAAAGGAPPTTPVVNNPPAVSPTDPAVRRRRLSNLYKITSSEYFSISFDCFEDPGQEEFVAASKGTSLREALATVCLRRGVDLSNVNVYLDSSKTPLSLITTETFWLGGKHLRIKAKDGIKSPVRSATVTKPPLLQHQASRKSSGSNRSGKTSRALSGAASTEDPTYLGSESMASSSGVIAVNAPAMSLVSSGSHEGSLKGKGTKTTTRWSGLFGSTYKDTKMDLLAEQLNEYSRHGIPRLPHLLSFEVDEDTEEALYSLEEDWKLIVTDWTTLPERQRQQQNAIWELVQTEVAYLRTLKVITDLFMACLCNLQAAQILNEIDTEKLFSNLPEIYVANRTFWADHVFPMLKLARCAKAPLDPTTLREGFIKFNELFNPYTKYCLDQSQCQQYCKEKDHDNELFKAYLAWCETQRDCNRLRLMDILVKPMQRLTKYSLLLKAVHKKTDAEIHKPVLNEMIEGVESFVGQVNSALRQRHEQERLREILSRIESYDAVEAKDEEVEKLVKVHCDLDLTRPMPFCSDHQRRHLLIEGDLKLRDQGSSKMDVHCFLFTDVLLVCKPVARKAERVKVIRPPFLVDRLVVIELSKDPAGLGLVYLNELGTASAALSLHASEPKLSKVWLEHLRKAQELYREARATAAAATLHTEPSICYYDEDDDMDYPHSALLVARSPRGSSRGSRGSSLVHSHRISPSLPFLPPDHDEVVALGSVEMNDGGAAAHHNRSQVESIEIKRVSSASSEEGTGPSVSTASIKQSPSPRHDRRSLLGRCHHHSVSPVPTPNTLTVQVPHVKAVSNQGQSLPNLLSIAVPVPAVATLSPVFTPGMGPSLSVSGRVQSASSLNQMRGVSYPPPSPRGITRAQPVPQSRNPPLVKTRRLTSVGMTSNFNVNMAGDLGTHHQQHSELAASINPTNMDLAGIPQLSHSAGTAPEIVTESFDLNEVEAELEDELADTEYDEARQQLLNAALAKRLGRNERLDNRRYHTAGAIEDIKKQDIHKNNSIHKRLSWNYGQQTNQQPPGSSHSGNLSTSRSLRSGLTGSATNSDSMLSFSSSGVSSTGSLHLSTASEVEDILELEPESKVHISSTYISSTDPPVVPTRGEAAVPGSAQHHVQVRPPLPPSTRAAPPPLPPPRTLPVPASLPLSKDLRLDVSAVCDGISSVQITVSGAESTSTPSATSSPTSGASLSNGKPSRADLIRMKDLILGDNSMEASEV